MKTAKNFFKNTVANFTNCEIPTGKSDYCSESGSCYFYTEKGVIRVSDHWGSQIASCSWYLDIDNMEYFNRVKTIDGVDYNIKCYKANIVAGFCRWEDFQNNN